MKLVKNVHVDGRWYGPAHGNAEDVPPEVAERITNPGAWEGGEPPRAGEPVVQQESGGSPSRPDREALEDRARELGVSVRSNMKDETLVERIRDAEASAEE